MDHTSWRKQTDTPLFPELEWNKPERRDQAGRLLIIGGYQHNLNAPGKAYEYVTKEGIGSVQIALPSKVKSLVGVTLPGALFLPSTQSGELARDGFEELITHVNWADTLLLPGDLGRNSQTTLLLADIISHTTQTTVLAKDTIDALKNTPELLINRENTTLILSFAQLQKLMQNLKLSTALTFNMDLVKLIEFLHEFTSNHSCAIMTLHQGKYLVASNGKISTTSALRHPEPVEGSAQISPQGRDDTLDDNLKWRVQAASLAACYQTWNPSKPFESLTHTAFLLK